MYCSYSGGDTDGRIKELQATEVSINVRSFAGVGVTLKVMKKVGMEGVELLSDVTQTEEATDENAAGDLWSTISK